MSSKTNYAFDHSANTLASHETRTVQNTSSYLIPYLKPGLRILDVGCGPGTITVSIAKLVRDGHITGLETASEIVGKAKALAEKEGVLNADFTIGDATTLPFPDDTFDLAYTHQVLLHVSKPVEVLREMRRVVKPGGLVCAREAEMESWIVYPESAQILQSRAVTSEIIAASGGMQATGRNLHVRAREAGFQDEDVKRGASAWLCTEPDERQSTGHAWARRFVESEIATKALDLGIRTREQLESYSKAWKQWADHGDGWLAFISGEIVCRKN